MVIGYLPRDWIICICRIGVIFAMKLDTFGILVIACALVFLLSVGLYPLLYLTLLSLLSHLTLWDLWWTLLILSMLHPLLLPLKIFRKVS